MKSLILLTIPLIFLSSCTQGQKDSYYQNLYHECKTLETWEQGGCEISVQTMEKNGFLEAKNRVCPPDMTINMNKTLGSKQWCEFLPPISNTKNLTGSLETVGTNKDFGSGFTLSQTDDETTLSYSGKIIKTWSHTPPEKVPFIWDEGCELLTERLNTLKPGEESTGKQRIWESLSIKERSNCMKERLGRIISIGDIQSSRFYTINESGYEWVTKYLFDTKTGKVSQESIPDDDIVGIFEKDNKIIFHLRYTRDASDEIWVYSDTFEFEKKWTETREMHTRIEKVEFTGNNLNLLLQETEWKTGKEKQESIIINL